MLTQRGTPRSDPEGEAPARPSPLRTATLIDGIPQAVSIQFNNLVYEMRATGRDVITLSLGEAFFDLPPFGLAQLSTPTGIHHYSHSRGLPALRQRLARYYREDFGVPVDPATEILFTAGSKAAIYMVLLSVVEPGDEVLVLEPFWLSYPEQVRMCRGRPVAVPHDVSILELGDWVSPRTRAIIINNPNNPTGRVYTESELLAVHDLAERHGLLIIADEAYNEFVAADSRCRSCAADDPDKRHTVVINSMSKNFGLSGWRVGYVIAHRRIIDQVLKVNQHVITCAPTILSCYLAERFDELLAVTRPQIRRVVAVRNQVSGWMTDAGIATSPGSASFYLFASLRDSQLSSTAFASRLLEERSVSVVPGIAYGASCDRYIRVSVGTEPVDRIQQGIAAIAHLLAETRAE